MNLLAGRIDYPICYLPSSCFSAENYNEVILLLSARNSSTNRQRWISVHHWCTVLSVLGKFCYAGSFSIPHWGFELLTRLIASVWLIPMFFVKSIRSLRDGTIFCASQDIYFFVNKTSIFLPYQKNEVSHYLDHIQPQIDDLARREKHLFQGLDPEALPEALEGFFWGVTKWAG